MISWRWRNLFRRFGLRQVRRTSTSKAQTGNELRTHQAIGSGGGIKQINASTVDFGASDKPLKPDDLAASGLSMFPTVIGARGARDELCPASSRARSG